MMLSQYRKHTRALRPLNEFDDLNDQFPYQIYFKVGRESFDKNGAAICFLDLDLCQKCEIKKYGKATGKHLSTYTYVYI